MGDDLADQLEAVDLAHADPDLYRHLHHVVDAVTRGPVTPATRLTELYQYNDPLVDNTLLRNLTGPLQTRVPCQVLYDDGKAYPRTERSGEKDCLLRLTFNKLVKSRSATSHAPPVNSPQLLAPCVRLEAYFMQGHQEQRENLMTLILEWHFNTYSGKVSGIHRYTHLNDEISFTAGAATCSGFNHLAKCSSRLDQDGQQIAKLLRSFTETETQQHMRFRLHPGRLTDNDRIQLEKIYSRLPGGSGLLLPSIGQVEFVAFGQYGSHVHAEVESMRRPFHLLSGPAPHPMVSLKCDDTFSTVKEAGMQLAYTANTGFAEQAEALRLWADVAHSGRILQQGKLFVLGVRFKKFLTLGGARDSIAFRLPDDFSCSLVLKIKSLPGNDDYKFRTSGTLTHSQIAFPGHDALFLLDLSSMQAEEEVNWEIMQDADRFEVHATPYMVNVTLKRQLETVADLQMSKNRRWHPILLNQMHDQLSEIDIASECRVSDEVHAISMRWLLEWKDWNAEQLGVIDGIRKAKGGMVIVMGPAGTGKTLLQQALAIYFYKLGYSILALAPANSNTDHMARDMYSYQIEIPDLKISRLYPSTRTYTAVEGARRNNVRSRLHQSADKVLSYSELLVAVEELDEHGSLGRPFGCVEQLLVAALDGGMNVEMEVRDSHSKARGSCCNAWDVVGELIASHRSGTLGKSINETYRLAYARCKADWLRRTRFLITTTGNVKANDLREAWSMADTDSRGVVVFVDEAAKDNEVNVWSGITCGAWGEKVKGCLMFGDDKQLTPTNTSAKGKIQFNAFCSRLNIPLPCRLVREGFPCFRLREQHRMHSTISAFPNTSFYEGQLRDGPTTNNDLDVGIKTVLQQILVGETAAAGPSQCLADNQARLAWIEITGRRLTHEALQSKYVQEHIDYFFGRIFPRLRLFCHETEQRLKDHLLVICAYKAALYAYKDMFEIMLKSGAVVEDDVPRVLTVDSSQGEESTMVVFDSSSQHGDVVGFVDDPGRCNVAFTRAKEIFWILGGVMENKHRRNGKRATTYLARYKRELDAKKKSHKPV